MKSNDSNFTRPSPARPAWAGGRGGRLPMPGRRRRGHRTRRSTNRGTVPPRVLADAIEMLRATLRALAAFADCYRRHPER
ncbi:MAG: hypothetical protein ABMA13_14890 [Chthoniobacteraceae bacterium]